MLVARADVSSQRSRGSIEKLPSGAYRVRVYGGVDPVTGRRHDLRETVPPGPRAAREAEKVRTRLLAQIDERRNPRTSATVAQLLDRHLKESRLGTNTTHTYRGLVDKHVLPFLGKQKVGSIEPDIVDSLYAELQRCREHCSRRGGTDHRTPRPHDCDDRCRPHQCRPLAASSIRQIHWILSGAFRRAVRWRWIATNPLTQVEPPSQPPPTPRPPTAGEAAKILEAAWTDPDWGMLVWLTMVTGQRRGELCALRWSHVDLPGGTLHLQRSIGQRGSLTWEKDTKTHQDRRIVLDPDTLRLLAEHRKRCEQRATAVGVELDDEAFVFSLAPDGSRHLIPDSVTQRYRKMTQRLGIKTSIHKLRHYSATELIAAGIDIRTVAGRLGHGSGGTTTLRTYTAWISESDQRAAKDLAARMPAPPSPPAARIVEIDPTTPYEKVAVDLRDRILNAELVAGLPIPPFKQLAHNHGVSVSTVHRAVSLLKDWGFVDVNSGRRTIVRRLHEPTAAAGVRGHRAQPSSQNAVLLDIMIRRLGTVVARFQAEADPGNPKELRRLLVDAVRRSGDNESEIGDYEMTVGHAGKGEMITTFVASTS
jgi:integrase/DNA-binding transcriptional regulator YhcF (GntR family)